MTAKTKSAKTRSPARRRTDWFVDARFGMFIHWGLYAMPARGEWIRHNEQIPNEDYEKFFERFDPEGE